MAPLMELWLNKHFQLITEQKQTEIPEKEREVLQTKFAQYMKFLFGGQKYYIGRSLADVHRDLGISNEQFDEATGSFIGSL